MTEEAKAAQDVPLPEPATPDIIEAENESSSTEKEDSPSKKPEIGDVADLEPVKQSSAVASNRGSSKGSNNGSPSVDKSKRSSLVAPPLRGAERRQTVMGSVGTALRST